MRLETEYYVEVREDLASIRRLYSEWEGLWGRALNVTTFQRPGWVLAWMQNFSPREPFLLAVREEGRLIALAPFLIYERRSNNGERERILGFMAGGVSDFLDILIDPLHMREALAALWRRIYAERNRWDTVELTDLAAHSSLLRNLQYLSFTIQKHEVCSFLPIPPDADDLKLAIPPHKWENIRNARNRLQRAGGGMVEIANENTLNAALDDLFRLHRARWAQECLPGVLQEKGIRELHQQIAPDLLAKGVLRLYTLRLNGSCLASAYSFFEQEQALCYLHGYDPQFAHISPGTLIIAAVIEGAMQAGKKIVHFLRGREEYKQSWGVREESTFCLRATLPNTARSDVFAA